MGWAGLADLDGVVSGAGVFGGFVVWVEDFGVGLGAGGVGADVAVEGVVVLVEGVVVGGGELVVGPVDGAVGVALCSWHVG